MFLKYKNHVALCIGVGGVVVLLFVGQVNLDSSGAI